MSQVTGTTWSDSVANSISMNTNLAEDVESTIWELDPMDTWALTNLDKVSAENRFHEWLGDQLAAATANINIEGDDVGFATAHAAKRYGNYCQIVSKTFIVSDTLEEQRKHGRSTETGRLGTKLMKELKRDFEYAMVRNQASSAGGAGTGRAMAGMESWIAGPTATTANTAANAVTATTNSTASTTPGFSGSAVVAPTDGTAGALTEGSVKAALQGAWEDGGDPRVILVGAKQKNVIDAFAGVATRMVDINRTQQASIIGAANLYVSSFGSPHVVTLSRYVRDSVVLCIDPDYWAVAFLRRPRVVSLAKTGDATKKLLVSEGTLVCRNPNASSKVVGCS